MPLRGIARQLTEVGIPSPTGKPYWHPSVLSKILANPIYQGTYTALRVQAVKPASRRGSTYGKTGRRQRNEDEQIPIPGLVSEPVVSSEQFQQVQERLARNKAQGGKVLHTYLLRGRVRCELCGRRMRGKFNTFKGHTYCRYVCSGTENPYGAVRCSAGSRHGPSLEGLVWDKIVAFLLEPEVFLGAVNHQEKHNREAIQPLAQSIKRLSERLKGLDDTEALAYAGFARGMTSEEIYRRVAAQLKAERAWIGEELERQERSLSESRQALISADMIRELYPRLAQQVQSASIEDRQFVLGCLDTQVTAGPSGVTISLAVPGPVVSPVSTLPRVGGWA